MTEDIINRTIRITKGLMEGVNTYQIMLLVYIAIDLGINLWMVLFSTLVIKLVYGRLIKFYLRQVAINMRKNPLMKDRDFIKRKREELERMEKTIK